MSYIALTLGFTALFAVLSFHKEYKTTWSILCAVVFVLFGVINSNGGDLKVFGLRRLLYL